MLPWIYFIGAGVTWWRAAHIWVEYLTYGETRPDDRAMAVGLGGICAIFWPLVAVGYFIYLAMPQGDES